MKLSKNVKLTIRKLFGYFVFLKNFEKFLCKTSIAQSMESYKSSRKWCLKWKYLKVVIEM